MSTKERGAHHVGGMRASRLLQLPAIRIVLALLVTLVPVTLAESSMHVLRTWLPLPIYYCLFAGVSVLITLVAYRAYVHNVEQRSATEVATVGLIGELSTGLLLGGGLLAIAVGILWLVGAYQVVGAALTTAVLGALATDIAGGLVEEVLFRGLMQHLLEKTVRWPPLAVVRAPLDDR